MILSYMKRTFITSSIKLNIAFLGRLSSMVSYNVLKWVMSKKIKI